mgnify:CR=1 FL=1
MLLKIITFNVAHGRGTDNKVCLLYTSDAADD